MTDEKYTYKKKKQAEVHCCLYPNSSNIHMFLVQLCNICHLENKNQCVPLSSVSQILIQLDPVKWDM